MVGIAFQLILDEPSGTVADFDHALDAVLCGDGQLHLVHDGVLTVVNLSIYDGKAEVANTRVGGDTFAYAFLSFLKLFAQYHAGVIHKVLVYGKSAVSFAEVYPIGFNLYRAVALLQEQYIRNNARARIGKEGIIRQANRAEKVCTLCNVFAYGGVLFIHCAGGGDKCNYAAGTDFIQSLGDEIIMYEEVVFIVSLIRNAVIAEWHVAYGNIKEAIG